MNKRLIVSMGIAIISLGVGFYLLNDIQQEKDAEKITPKYLNQLLDESNQRLKIVKDEFYNGQYNGDLSIHKTIDIIESEVKIQKELLENYKNLPEEIKTDKTIDARFFQLGKYSWAGEDSMLMALKKQLP